jgi:curved DNA-binding protein CbpA
VQQANPDIKSTEVFKKASENWKALSDEEKKVFYNKKYRAGTSSTQKQLNTSFFDFSQPYTEQVEKAKEEYDVAKKAYELTHPPAPKVLWGAVF